MTALRENDITEVEVHFLEFEPEAINDLKQLHLRFGVPEDMRGRVVVCVNDKYLFENFVPVEIILDFLINHKQRYESIVVFRDEIKDIYRVMDEEGYIKECELSDSFYDCVDIEESGSLASVLLIVVMSGLLDGINPCAFAVLLFFIALLFMAGTATPYTHTRKRILITGSIYILTIFLAYLVVGLSLIKIITVIPFPHMIARGGGFLMIFLGFINLKDYFWPDRGFSLGIPKSQWETIKQWVHKFTFPSSFVVALMVAFFEFPCTGGIYVAIIGLLALRSTSLEGFLYLVLYNFAFVLPLVIILIFASNKRTMSFSLIRWRQKEHKTIKLLSGLGIVILGMFLLVFGFI